MFGVAVVVLFFFKDFLFEELDSYREAFKKIENKKIPEDIDYEKVNSLRLEAKQKLEKYRPVSVGQASRISGVSPSDISVLLIHLSKNERK